MEIIKIDFEMDLRDDAIYNSNLGSNYRLPSIMNVKQRTNVQGLI